MKITSKIFKVSKLCLSLLRYFVIPDSWRKLEPCDVLLLAHNNDRALNINGKSYSQLIHTIRYYLEKEGIKCSGISTLFDIKSYKHNYYEDKTINVVFLFNIIKAVIKSLFVKQAFSEIKINSEVTIWNKILRKTQPKLIIGIQPYDSLCMACHHLGIKIFDFQHGAITENGPYYGRELYFNKDLTRLPTGYLCWNNESAEILNKWCSHKNIQVEVLGHPWLYRFRKNDDSDFLLKNIFKTRTFNTNQKRILISLQWGLDEIYPDYFNKNDIIHPALLDTIHRLDSEVMWLIRLHPIQMKSKKIFQNIKKIFKNNHSIDIDWSSIQPLPVVLSLCHGHITWDSYVVVEAAQFSVKSYVINPGHFSTNRTIDNFQNNNKDIRLPYTQQELEGLLRRAPNVPNAEDIIAWTKEISPNNVINLTSNQCIFNVDKLIKLLREQTEYSQ